MNTSNTVNISQLKAKYAKEIQTYLLLVQEYFAKYGEEEKNVIILRTK